MIKRRSFIGQATALSTLAWSGQTQAASAAKPQTADLPQARLGKLTVSRLIFGGNMISGIAHSRDLIYAGDFFKHYHTDERVLTTWEQSEDHGINTFMLLPEPNVLRLVQAYRKQKNSRFQWLAQIVIKEDALEKQIKEAADHGASGIIVDGETADALVKAKKYRVLETALAAIQKTGLVAGLGAHQIQTIMASEEAGWKPDCYLKTFNSKRYWSAEVQPRQDNVWEDKPQDTMNFMVEVSRPWIACKVLGAGAIRPEQGFQYAMESGADFLCAGMFDFQIQENAKAAVRAYEKARQRSRAWCG